MKDYDIIIIKQMRSINQENEEELNHTKQYARLNNSIIDNEQIISKLNKKIDRRINIGYYCQVQSQRKSMVFPARQRHTFSKKMVHKPYKKLKKEVGKIEMVDGEMNTDAIYTADEWQNTSKIQVEKQPEIVLQDEQMQWSCDITEIEHKNYSIQWQEEVIQCCDASIQYDLVSEQVPPKIIEKVVQKIIYIETKSPDIIKQHVSSQCQQLKKKQFSIQYNEKLPQTESKDIQIQIPDYQQLTKINTMEHRLKYLKMKELRQIKIQKKTQQKIQIMKLKQFIDRLESKIHLVEEKEQHLKSKRQIERHITQRELKFQEDKKRLKEELVKKYHIKMQNIINKILSSPEHARNIDKSHLQEQLKKLQLEKELQMLSKQELISYKQEIQGLKQQLKRQMFKRLQYENDVTQESEHQGNEAQQKYYLDYNHHQHEMSMNDLFPSFKIKKRHVGSIVKNAAEQESREQKIFNERNQSFRIGRTYWKEKSDLNYRYSMSNIQRKQRKIEYIKRLDKSTDILGHNPQEVDFSPNKSYLRRYNPLKNISFTHSRSQLQNKSTFNQPEIKYNLKYSLTMQREQMQTIRQGFQYLFKDEQLFKYLYSEVDKIKLGQTLFRVVNIPIKSPKESIKIHNYYSYIVFQYRTPTQVIFILLFHHTYIVQYGRVSINPGTSYEYYKNNNVYKNGEIFQYIHLEEMFNGFYLNGVKHGYGILSNTLMYYEGEFLYGKKQGKGKMILQNGDIYVGLFTNNQFNGEGNYKWTNGQIYDGFFYNGLKNGFGKHSYRNKDTYEGMYKLNKRHGKGTYRWSNGSIYQGQFQNDEKNGLGKVTDQNGNITAGIWKYDELIQLCEKDKKVSGQELPVVNYHPLIRNR